MEQKCNLLLLTDMRNGFPMKNGHLGIKWAKCSIRTRRKDVSCIIKKKKKYHILYHARIEHPNWPGHVPRVMVPPPAGSIKCQCYAALYCNNWLKQWLMLETCQSSVAKLLFIMHNY